MITAITAQILDANNYNISPAVNVESIYFERVSDDGTTHRMSLRNRTIVAGDTVNLDGMPVLPINSVKDFSIPYVYFSNVQGTSDSTGRIIQANAAMFKVGESLYNALMFDVSNRISFNEASDEYFSRNDKNYVKDRIRIGENYNTNGIEISRNSGNPYIAFNNDRLKLSVSGNNTSVYANNNLDVLATTVKVHYGNSSHGIDMVDDTITIDDRIIEIGHPKYDSGVSGSNIILTGASFSVAADELSIKNSDGVTSLDINQTEIKLTAPHTYIYDKEIENPSLLSGDYRSVQKVYLCLNYTGNDSPYGYYWAATPTLTISDGKTVDDNDRVYLSNILGDGDYELCQGHIYTTEFTGITPIGYEQHNIIGNTFNENSVTKANHIYVKYIQSGNEYRNIAKKHDSGRTDENIQFITINNKSIIGSDNLEVIQPEQINRLLNVTYMNDVNETQQQYKIFGGSLSQIKKLNDPRAANLSIDDPSAIAVIQYSDMVYYKGNGALYASNYYSNSDERLKEDIQEIKSENYGFSLHSFIWKKDGSKSYGFIAQEVETSHPELVDTDENGIKKVNYDAALSFVVGQQQCEINELKKEVELLKTLLKK